LTTNPVFLCVISYTGTSEIPGITVAGANPDLVKYTSAADSEFLYYGRCKCISEVPATPDGKPTPAIITRTALRLTNIPFLVVDAGAMIKPSIPYFSFNIGSGNNIKSLPAVSREDVKRAFDYGMVLGDQISKNSDLIVIGESIPGGTTTALAVLLALGVDAKFKVSSSMPENPHNLKNSIVSESMIRAGINFGELRDDPFEAIALFGDPVMPSIAGITIGVKSSNCRIMLAGGTQMAAILALLKALRQSTDNICVGTTSYVAEDRSSKLIELVNSISADIPIYSSDLHMIDSIKPGLQAFARGFVKEGVGAGGVSITSMLKSNDNINGTDLLKAIEQEYEKVIERTVV
jgi:uncharacterized protein (TIGR00303 family)